MSMAAAAPPHPTLPKTQRFAWRALNCGLDGHTKMGESFGPLLFFYYYAAIILNFINDYYLNN
jgi:hypothetical protein